MTIHKWLSEPLLHFLVAGAALFALVGWLSPPDNSGRIIRVDEAQLLEHLQQRAQVYDGESFAALLAEMSPAERTELLEEAAQTEALYREGLALGLVEADPLIRQRVIQQMRQLLMEEAAAGVDLSDEDVRAFYDANSDRYALGARASFGHVFLSGERRGEMARSDAVAVLRELREGDVSLAASGAYGDRFLYQRNYSGAGMREIASQFGTQFARSLFALEPKDSWQGPLQSEFGWHAVLLRQNADAQVPPFAEIAERVREDALAEERARRTDAALDRLMERYTVKQE